MRGDFIFNYMHYYYFKQIYICLNTIILIKLLKSYLLGFEILIKFKTIEVFKSEF